MFLEHAEKGPDSSAAVQATRNMFFTKENKWMSAKVYDYRKLQAGNIVQGPAIIEATDTTIVIPSDQEARVDKYLNVVIK